MSVRLFEPAELRSARILQLKQYWESVKRDRAMPSRADIDPAEIKDLLPHLELVDIVQEPFTVHYRLVGTTLVHNVGFDYTGANIDELMFGTEDETAWARLFRRLWRDKVPLYGLSTHPCGPNDVVTHEFAMFPLSDDGVSVNKSVNIEDYLDPPEISAAPGWHRRGRKSPKPGSISR